MGETPDFVYLHKDMFLPFTELLKIQQIIKLEQIVHKLNTNTIPNQ